MIIRILLILLGILSLTMIILNGQMGAESVRWPKAQGLVTKKETKRHGYRASRTTLFYYFRIMGVEYDGLAQKMHGSAEKARAYLTQYPRGGKATVYYDPNNPRRNLLVVGVHWGSAIGLLFLGLIMVLAGLFIQN